MVKYNAMLIQDAEEMVGYLAQPLNEVLPKFNPEEYRSSRAIYEWIIREHLESTAGLACIDHNAKLQVYHRIRHRLKQSLGFPLEALLFSYIRCPQLYDDNIFIQVDLKEPWDLYIQYYRHGRTSDNKF